MKILLLVVVVVRLPNDAFIDKFICFLAARKTNNILSYSICKRGAADKCVLWEEIYDGRQTGGRSLLKEGKVDAYHHAKNIYILKSPKGSAWRTISCISCIMNSCPICVIKLRTQRPRAAQSLMTLPGAEHIIKPQWLDFRIVLLLICIIYTDLC